MKEYNIDELVSSLEIEMHNNYNGLYLTETQAKKLMDYGFDYNKYSNLKSLIFDLDNYLEEIECEELEDILYELSEFDYYHNTNK